MIVVKKPAENEALVGYCMRTGGKMVTKVDKWDIIMTEVYKILLKRI